MKISNDQKAYTHFRTVSSAYIYFLLTLNVATPLKQISILLSIICITSHFFFLKLVDTNLILHFLSTCCAEQIKTIKYGLIIGMLSINQFQITKNKIKQQTRKTFYHFYTNSSFGIFTKL